MKKKLIDLLESLRFPVFMQGTLNENEDYPETFFTYWNFQDPEILYYDNVSHGSAWGFWVWIYSNDPEVVEITEKKVKTMLKSHGFILSDVSDANSGKESHTGRMMTVLYMEV